MAEEPETHEIGHYFASPRFGVKIEKYVHKMRQVKPILAILEANNLMKSFFTTFYA